MIYINIIIYVRTTYFYNNDNNPPVTRPDRIVRAVARLPGPSLSGTRRGEVDGSKHDFGLLPSSAAFKTNATAAEPARFHRPFRNELPSHRDVKTRS